MAQPVHTEEYNSDSIVLSEWRVDEGVTLALGEELEAGAILGKVGADGTYKLSTASASDGSEVPSAILLEDVDASASAMEVPVLLGGKVDENLLVLGSGHTLDSIRNTLREKNIYLTKKG